jgi:HK97 family phage portal protein
MSIWNRLFGKASEARQVLVMNQVGKPVNTSRNYEAFSKEGYQVNVIGYKCVSLISRACAGIEWELYRGEREIEEHPLLELLKSPNPLQSKSAFFEAIVAYYQIAGNSYIEAVKPSPKAAPMELWPLRPDKIRIIPGQLGLPAAFEFKGASKDKLYPVDQVTGQGDLLHMKTFHPTDPWYGMSPIEAAVYSVDQHNESGRWNLSLLQNMGTPSGALVVKQDANNPSGTLPAPNYENLKKQLNDKYAGSKNAGRMMLLEGGIEWRQMGFNAKDMDWMEGRKMAARDVALAFGVPPIILNIPGDSTFANYKEARLSLYEDTIIPLMDMIRDELNSWLVPMFGDDIKLEYDKDSIEALDLKRSEKFTQISSAGFLTTNEKRVLLGFEAVEGGDDVLVASGLIPIKYLSDEPEPEPNTVQNTDANAEDETDGQNENEDDGQKNIQVNLLTRREKLKALTQINLMRDKLYMGMYHDLKDDLQNQAEKLGKALADVEPRVMEYAALQVLSDSKDIEATLKKHIKRAMKMFGDPILSGAKLWGPEFETKNSVKFEQFVQSFIDKHTADAVTKIEGTSIKKARKIIKEAISVGQEEGWTSREISKQLQSEMSSLSASRANTIARTEIGIASNQGSLEAAKALEIPDLMKEWVSTNDDRTRDNDAIADHAGANGQRVGLNEKFLINPDASMDGPGDPSASAEQIINCRCATVYIREGKTLIPQFEEK